MNEDRANVQSILRAVSTNNEASMKRDADSIPAAAQRLALVSGAADKALMSVVTYPAPGLTNDAQELDSILRNDAIVSMYQPIVKLATGEVIGFEALSRGPKGSILEFPDRLFAAAREAGRLAELDWACRAQALRGALAHGLGSRMLLFINVEPDAAFVPPPDELLPLLEETREKLRIVAEFTERGLVDRPTEVLAAAREWRRSGMAVALDDLTADAAPLAMLPFVRPDILKLDLSLIQEPGDSELGETLVTINAWVESSGALTVAEGIETEQHLERARSLGADFGQGWMFGRPGPLADVDTSCPSAVVLGAPRPISRSHPPSPYELISQLREPRIATKEALLAMSRELERHASSMGASGVVISTIQDSRFYNSLTREIYRGLADDLAMVGVIGAGMFDLPASRVMEASIDRDDPPCAEWDVLTISPYYCGAMVARDLGDSGPDLQRRFQYCITHDADVIAEAALPLIKLIAPMDSSIR